MTFRQKLENIIKKNNSLLCVGLDPDLDKFPKYILNKKNPIFQFNKDIINETSNLVCCYKLNIAYYASQGMKGLNSLLETINYIHSKYADVPIILDAKRADVGHTSQHYAKEVFDIFKCDGVTVNPYFGFDSIEPFLKYKDKGIIVLCKTSNPNSSEFQNLKIDKKPLYIKVAERVVVWNEKYDNCLMVIGATYPQELKEIREITSDMFFLIPGIGAQGGDLEATLQAGLTKNKSGLIISSSRGIIFSENPRKEALSLRNEINKYR